MAIDESPAFRHEHCMRTRTQLAAVAALAASTLPSLAHAHIKMLLPTPWIVEDDGVGGFGGGNPQKTGPCGTDPAGATLTNQITEFMAGETIEVKWTETIDHPGYSHRAGRRPRAAQGPFPDVRPELQRGQQ
jgi:hypothetical protein